MADFRPVRLLPLIGAIACAPEPSTLSRIDPEWAGERCADGGVVVHEGRDLDADGVLHDDEIERSTWVCAGETPDAYDGLYAGSYTIRTHEDITALSGIDALTGDLWIRGLQLQDVRLPGLRVIGGRVLVGEFGSRTLLRSVDLPDLAWADGGVELRGSPLLERFSVGSLGVGTDRMALVVADMPSLVDIPELQELRVAGKLEITGESSRFRPSSLAVERAGEVRIEGSFEGDFTLPSLTAVSGALVLGPTTATAASFPALQRLGSLEIDGAPTLERVSAPELTEVDDAIRLMHVDALEAVDLSALRWLGGHLDVVFAPSLQRLELPALTQVDGRLKIQDNGLRTLEFPVLEAVLGSLWVTRHPHLEALDLGRLRQSGAWHTLAFAFELNPRLAAIRHSGEPLDVQARLVLRANHALPDLSAFAAIIGVTGDVVITNNAALDPCAARQLVETIGLENIGGVVEIGDACP